MTEDHYTQRPISHAEAREVAGRLINSHFNKSGTEHARISIPANPERDDDLLILAYIKQQEEQAAPVPPAVTGGLVKKGV